MIIKIVDSKMALVECLTLIKNAFTEYKYFKVKIEESSRTLDQNQWWYQAYKMIALQTGESPQDVRRYCKLTFGLVILFSNDAETIKIWRKALKALTYQERLIAMDKIDVTSTFNLTEGKLYINSIISHYENFDLPEKQ